MSVNLVEHVYEELSKIVRSKNQTIPILPELKSLKELSDEAFMVIEYVYSVPSSDAGGTIELDMRWEVRYFRKIDARKGSRHIVQDAAWKLGAMFHRTMLPNPYAEDPMDGGVYVHYVSSQDDNFDFEAQTYESWVTELSIIATVSEAETEADGFLSFPAKPDRLYEIPVDVKVTKDGAEIV